MRPTKFYDANWRRIRLTYKEKRFKPLKISRKTTIPKCIFFKIIPPRFKRQFIFMRKKYYGTKIGVFLPTRRLKRVKK